MRMRFWCGMFGLALAAAFARAETKATLLAYWNFDAIESDTLRDMSDHGRHGKIHGSPQRVQGIAGSGLRFRSNDDYVDFGAPIIPAKDFTISIWINCDDTEKQFFLGQYKYADPNRLDLAVREGCVRIQVNDIVDSPKLVRPKVWHHLAYVRGNGRVAVYLDGQRVAEAPLPAPVLQTENLVLGKIFVPKQDSFRFTGVVDELKIWSTALSEVEIRASYVSRLK
jgi:hypothetical protein